MSDLTVTCPECGRPDRMVTKSGRIMHHNDPAKNDRRMPFGVRCAGSGRLVEDAKERVDGV